MFGWRRKRATKFAIDSLRPFVGTIQLQGMPPGFWLDPYILGFFHFMISHRLKLATLSGLAGEEMGFALTETFTAISNMNGIAIANRGLELLTARDPEYYRGADDASAISYYLLRVLKNEAEHPLVQTATGLACAAGKTMGDRHEIYSMMYMASLFKEVARLRGVI